MSDIHKKDDAPLSSESQRERWLKYGGNVVLTTIIVLALAVLVSYLAERKTRRIDTTFAGLYSLKPQTINIIKGNPQKIQITSLYTKAKQGNVATETTDVNVADRAEKVADLLEEYKTKGQNISVDTIDPVSNPGKVDDLIEEVSAKYGGQVDKYKAFAKSYPEKFKAMAAMAQAEVKPMGEAFKSSTTKPVTDDKIAEAFDELSQIHSFFRGLTPNVQARENLVQKALRAKPPDFKAIREDADRMAGFVNDNIDAVLDRFKKQKDDAKFPEPMRRYMAESLPRIEAIKKAAGDLLAETKALGEIKVDTLREALRQRNSILIRGEKEWKIIPYEQVWRSENRSGASEAAKIKPRFSGEQMITTSILALQQPRKLKVAFVRAGGPPLTEGMNPFVGKEAGPFSVVADRLREYNYDVLEKDLTGMYAMQQAQQQQQQMSAPEPSDADIKDAVWVVVDTPGQPTQFGPAQTIAPKVVEHLANGGSALFLAMPGADNMSAALSDWGITLRVDAMCVHEAVKEEGAETDIIEKTKKNPLFFEVRDWGDHPITSALRSLPGIFFYGIPVEVTSADKMPRGVKVSSIIPIPGAPSAPNSWGMTDLKTRREGSPTFNPEKDLPGPLFGGAVAEKEGGGRVVVFGSLGMVSSDAVTFPDPELYKKDIYVIRFPGNGELFSNAIYWLSKQETMIAISPASMDVGRIEDISHGAQSFWRVGILLVGLPLMVIAMGAMMYLTRRD